MNNKCFLIKFLTVYNNKISNKLLRTLIIQKTRKTTKRKIKMRIRIKNNKTRVNLKCNNSSNF